MRNARARVIQAGLYLFTKPGVMGHGFMGTLERLRPVGPGRPGGLGVKVGRVHVVTGNADVLEVGHQRLEPAE